MTDRNRLAPLIVIVLAAAAWASPRSQALDGPKAQGTVRVDFDVADQADPPGPLPQLPRQGEVQRGALAGDPRGRPPRGRGRARPSSSGRAARACSSSSSPGSIRTGGCPTKGDPLPKREVGLLRAWIDQGLAWPEGFSFGFRKAPLAPRNAGDPASPGGRTLDHPVDRFVARYLAEHGRRRSTGRPCPDRVFARRASLDLSGSCRLPSSSTPSRTTRGRTRTSRLVEALLGGPPGLRRPLADVLERRPAERVSGHRVHRRRPDDDHAMALPVSLREQALRPVRPRAGQPRPGLGGVREGDRLARRGQRQPGPAGAGRAERLAGLPRHEPQVRELPRQLREPLEADRRLRPGQRLRREAAGDPPLRQADGQDRRRSRFIYPRARHDRRRRPHARSG